MNTPEAPSLIYVGTLEVSIGAPVDFGLAAHGRRRFIPITGGRVTGPWLTGHVLAGGGDWQTIRPDGVVDLQARYAFELVDGTLVEIDNGGYRHASPEVSARIAAGETVPRSAYYFHTCARLTTTSRRHDWLNRTLFVANAEREADRVVIELFAMGCRKADMRPNE